MSNAELGHRTAFVIGLFYYFPWAAELLCCHPAFCQFRDELAYPVDKKQVYIGAWSCNHCQVNSACAGDVEFEFLDFWLYHLIMDQG